MKRVTVPGILRHNNDKPLVMITAYDTPTARIADNAGVDMILVGDSVGVAVLGFPDTLSVTIDHMIHHTSAVARGVRRSLIIGDLPFGSSQIGGETCLKDAVALMRAGAHAVKIEGSQQVELINNLVGNGIPVMGHIGLTPQSLHQFGGFKVQGRSEQDRDALVTAAQKLENAGVFSIVIECVPPQTARRITEAVSIPTIGIGAGSHVNGQVLVLHDILTLNPDFKPRFIKQYCNLSALIGDAIKAYCDDVRNHHFPSAEHTYEDLE